jgi:hypothetical protein
MLERRTTVADLADVKAQLDIVHAAVDAWSVAAQQASTDATTAASAGAIAATAQQAADASAALSAEKQATAKAEAEKLAAMFGDEPPARKRK